MPTVPAAGAAQTCCESTALSLRLGSSPRTAPTISTNRRRFLLCFHRWSPATVCCWHSYADYRRTMNSSNFRSIPVSKCLPKHRGTMAALLANDVSYPR